MPRLEPVDYDPFQGGQDPYAAMVEGRAARQAGRRAATPMPPEATREQVGQTLGAFTHAGWDAATAVPRAAYDLTNEAMTNVPGQDPRYLTSTANKSAHLASIMPSMGGAWEVGLSGLAQQAAERGGTDIGMYKLVPSEPYVEGIRGRPGSQSYNLLGHEDEVIAQLPSMKYDPKTKEIKTDMYSGRPYQQMNYQNQALLNNPGAWSLSAEDKIGMAQALAREYPEAVGIWGHRVSGARRGQNQLIPFTHWLNREAMKREEEAMPRLPEMEKSLFDLAMESIRQPKPPFPPEPPIDNPAWTGMGDPFAPFAHNRPPALDPTAAARQRAGFDVPPRYRTREELPLPASNMRISSERWFSPEMSRIEPGPHGYSVYNREGQIMAQGVSRNEAIANAERMGAIRPPVNTREHERMFGMSGNPPEPPGATVR